MTGTLLYLKLQDRLNQERWKIRAVPWWRWRKRRRLKIELNQFEESLWLRFQEERLDLERRLK